MPLWDRVFIKSQITYFNKTYIKFYRDKGIKLRFKKFTVLTRIMTCHFRPPPNYLMRADEPAYFVTVVFRDKNGKAQISKDAYNFSSRSNLEKTMKELEKSIGISKDEGNWEIAYTEIKGTTTEAKKETFSRYGLRLIEPKPPSREEWSKILDNFTELAKGQPHISEVYLTGSLAKGASSSKDADVLMFVNKCPDFLKCEIFRKLICSDKRFAGLRVLDPDPNFEITKSVGGKKSSYPIDVFCFPEEESKSIGQYRIGQHRQLLFQRKN
jgi:hypothetical protein